VQIGRMETYQEDTKFILENVGLINKNNNDDFLNFSLQKSNSIASKKLTKENLSYFHLVKSYLNTLSPAEFEALYNIYWIDFEMFGYDVKKYKL
jgi:hypothetical protein